MHRILSTCNFSRANRPAALWLAVGLVVCIEVILAAVLPGRFFSHEVDKILYELDTKTFTADYLLLGDSVGRQVLVRYKDDSRFAMLATNAAVEMTGQYFLLRRYLERHRLPRGVIFAGLPSHIERNLEQAYTENYVLRTFTHLSEIAELLLVKANLAQTLKSLAYKLFPSYKYRLNLQRYLLGKANGDIANGSVDKPGTAAKAEMYSVDRLLARYRPQKVSLRHLRKLIELLTKNGIQFYYIPVPIKQGGAATPLQAKYETLFALLSSWRSEGLKIEMSTDIVRLPPALFQDTVHFNAQGVVAAGSSLDRRIEEWVARQQGQATSGPLQPGGRGGSGAFN